MSDHPKFIKQQEIAKNFGKWVKYRNKWYNPLEWNIYSRSAYEGIDSNALTYKHSTELLHEGREHILSKSAMGEDVTRLLVRYFEFEKRVIKWLEDSARMNDVLSF